MISGPGPDETVPAVQGNKPRAQPARGLLRQCTVSQSRQYALPMNLVGLMHSPFDSKPNRPNLRASLPLIRVVPVEVILRVVDRDRPQCNGIGLHRPEARAELIP